MTCLRCGVAHADDLLTCVGNLIDQREQADKVASYYLSDLHFMMRYAAATEWLHDPCPACGGSNPKHADGCLVGSFLDRSGARELSQSGKTLQWERRND